MMADDQALQGPHPHLANGSRGRSNLLPYQPHGFTQIIFLLQGYGGSLASSPVSVAYGGRHRKMGSYPWKWELRMFSERLVKP